MAEENVSIYEAKEIAKGKIGQMESVDLSMTSQFPELRRKKPELFSYKYRDEEDDISGRRQKISYADLVRKEGEDGTKDMSYKEEGYNRSRRQCMPRLINKNMTEDRKENYYKNFNNREEEIA